MADVKEVGRHPQDYTPLNNYLNEEVEAEQH